MTIDEKLKEIKVKVKVLGKWKDKNNYYVSFLVSDQQVTIPHRMNFEAKVSLDEWEQMLNGDYIVKKMYSKDGKMWHITETEAISYKG